MENDKFEAFERQRVPHEFRSDDHFFFDSSESGELFAIPREILIQGEVYNLLESGGVISDDATVTNSEIGPRSIIKALSTILNSTIENTTVDDSFISDATIVNPTTNTHSYIKNTSIGALSTVIASDIENSNIGGMLKLAHIVQYKILTLATTLF